MKLKSNWISGVCLCSAVIVLLRTVWKHSCITAWTIKLNGSWQDAPRRCEPSQHSPQPAGGASAGPGAVPTNLQPKVLRPVRQDSRPDQNCLNFQGRHRLDWICGTMAPDSNTFEMLKAIFSSLLKQSWDGGGGSPTPGNQLIQLVLCYCYTADQCWDVQLFHITS